MILYKFKSLRNIEHVFDILHNQRLFCTKYSNLNDPFEGIFFVVVSIPTPGLPVGQKMTHNVDNIYPQSGHIKICSLSNRFDDVRLWAHYADGFKGITIAIDFSDIEPSLYEVRYFSGLPQFLDLNILGKSNIPPEILARKTEHWKYEAEYRIIQDKDYYLVNGKIKTIFTGQRISVTHKELLKKITPEEIPIYTTKLNTESVLIEQDALLR